MAAQLYYPFIGRVAAAPTTQGTGDKAVTKFVLMRNEYAGKDRDERTVAIQFTAFRNKAEAIAKHVNKGDQLFVTFRIENNNYDKDGEDIFGFNFIIDDFEFGAPGAISREKFPAKSGNAGAGAGDPGYDQADLSRT